MKDILIYIITHYPHVLVLCTISIIVSIKILRQGRAKDRAHKERVQSYVDVLKSHHKASH